MAKVDFIAVSRLLCEGRPSDYPVAHNRQDLQSWAAFASSVAGLTARLRRSDAQSWLIATDDAYELATALLAVLQAEKRVLLPAMLQAGHLSELAEAAGGVLLGGQIDFRAERSMAIHGSGGEAEASSFHPIDPDVCVIQLHTSGSSGRPEPVAKPLRCLEAEVAMQEDVFGGLGARSVLATVPPYHIYGLLFRVLWPLSAGRVIEAESLAFPEELAVLTQQRRAPFLVSSPAFLRRALPMLDLPRIGRNLRGVFSSGGPLPPDVAAAYNAALRCQVIEIYGSTETGGIARRVVEDAAAPPAWQPLPGVEVTLAADGATISIKSPFLPSMEVFETGDRGRIMGDGGFILEGRKDRIVKLEERRVSLVELEERLKACAEVGDVRVVAIEDEGHRTQLGAVVAPSSAGWQVLKAGGKQALRERLLDVLKPHVEALARPRRWRFVRRLPESGHGKVPLAALLELFQPATGKRIDAESLGRVERDGCLELHMRLSEDLAFFDGHFDAAAILPGVVQLDWAIRQARRYFPIAGDFYRIEALKFFHILPAGAEVRLQLEFDAAKSSLSFAYLAGDVTHSSGRVRFGDPQ